MPVNERNEEFIILVKKYMGGTASEQEISFLEKYYNFFEKEPAIISTLSETEKQEFEMKIQQAILTKIRRPAMIIPFFKTNWFQGVAAAVIIIAISFSAYYIFSHRGAGAGIVTNSKTQPAVQDVAPPASTNAVLTLDNGTKIVLDSAQNGALAVQGNVKVVKLADGQISYTGTAGSNEVTYNTLAVPRGSQVVSLTLADGSRVWMNAESSLRYPTAFVGDERKVEITGEAYFEVTPHPLPLSTNGEGGKMPFIVKNGETEVEVLGTHFNVNAYDDESSTRVTLLEGSVKVKKGNESVTIKPNDQAEINKQGKISLIKNVDVEEVIAWKNGLFVFNNTELGSIMRQIGRWYDVDVQYSGAPAIEKHYSGYVPRLVNLSKVLHMLESAGGVEFTIDGKKITVKVK
jgi:transmembrane sensor